MISALPISALRWSDESETKIVKANLVDAIMVKRARKRPNREQGWLLVRYLITGFIGGFAVFSFFSPRQRLDDDHPPRLVDGEIVRLPDFRDVSNETILSYSQFNPRLWTNRDRIRFLLEVLQSGKSNLKEAMKLRKTAIKATIPMSGEQGNASWISLFLKLNDTDVSRFVQVSQNWLGDGDGLNPGMVQDLVRTVKGPLDRNAARWNRSSSTTQIDGDNFNSGEEKRYQSCAVVGNSKVLLERSYGALIDSNEMVIRLNNAEVSRNSTYVGNRTTLSFMNSDVFQRCANTCACDKYGAHVPIIVYILHLEHLVDVANLGDWCTSESLLIVTPSRFDALCAAILKWYSVTKFLRHTFWGLSEWTLAYDDHDFRYSSGMQAVVLALGMCERVNLFGFGEGSNAGRTQHHTEDWKEIWLHDYESEYLFYEDLVSNRTIPYLTHAGIPIPEVRIFS